MGLRYLDYSVSVEESVGVEESSLMEMLGPRLHPPQRLGQVFELYLVREKVRMQQDYMRTEPIRSWGGMRGRTPERGPQRRLRRPFAWLEGRRPHAGRRRRGGGQGRLTGDAVTG